MSSKEISIDIMQQALMTALSKCYSFNSGIYTNESDFKHELYHQLASAPLNGSWVTDKLKDSNSCYLHAEGKAENGPNGKKIDLLICNPHIKQSFNYGVDFLIEIKQSMNLTGVKAELKKINTYKKKYKRIYLVSINRINKDQTLQYIIENNKNYQDIVLVGPDDVKHANTKTEPRSSNYDDIFNSVNAAINEALTRYGFGRQQYQGYYWCNYEGELNKKQSYPCEGDFVALLYHLIRKKEFGQIRINSEVKPQNSSTRIDLTISSLDNSWCMPIDVKMNWDQFKPKPNRTPVHEAALINYRFELLSKEFKQIKPIVIVIQGVLAQVSDKKSISMGIVSGNLKLSLDGRLENARSSSSFSSKISI